LSRLTKWMAKMTKFAATVARMHRTRRAAERAAGRVLVETIEAGSPINGMVNDAGCVHGTDRDPRSLIYFSGVAKARRAAALAKLDQQ